MQLLHVILAYQQLGIESGKNNLNSQQSMDECNKLMN